MSLIVVSLGLIEQIGGCGSAAAGNVYEFAGIEALQIGVAAGSLVSGGFAYCAAWNVVGVLLDENIKHLALAFGQGPEDVIAERGSSRQRIEVVAKGRHAFRARLDTVTASE